MQIRFADQTDLSALLALYAQFRGTSIPEINERIMAVWRQIMRDENHHVILAEAENVIVSICVLVIIPNLNHDQRPYALIENVITDIAHRKKGYGSAVLQHAVSVAQEHGCYKVMLMTGSKLESTLRFYEQAGFNRHNKTGFVRWLD